MATQPFFSPKFRAFDSNGDPLAGGLLYSYEAGTSTPLATYTTRAGGVANANPVVLDANGEANVWTTPGLDYKFELRDSAGVVQWTVDNVPSPADLDSLADGSLRIPDGTVSIPSLAFTNDTDSGLYRVGANNPAIAAGSTKVQDWTAAGTTVTGTLNVTGAATLASIGNTPVAAANPASTTGFSNVLTPLNLPKAWATFTTGAAPTMIAGFNVAGVTVVGGPILRVTLATGLTTSAYAVLASTPNSGWTIHAAINSATEINVSGYNTSGAGASDTLTTTNITVTLLVFGPQ